MTADPASATEAAIITELISRKWATEQQIKSTRDAISSKRLKGPIHHALQSQRLLDKNQVGTLDEIMHRSMSIDDFQVERKLGSGAMGEVFLAHRRDDPGTRVAIKIIAKRFADDENFVKRFEREISALTNLHHPSIANAVAYGRHLGLPYLAMEFIGGPSLAEMLEKNGPLPEPYVWRVAIQVAGGLDYVFNQTQLVHRDLKPENLLVVPEAGQEGQDLFTRQDRAVLIDFGLARSFSEDERLTMTGITMGTPHYMSPEQIRGSQNLDSRSDLYGLGATIFHLLTGRTPYKGTSPGAVMTAHLTEPIPDPGELVPSLSDEGRQIVKLCMAKEPDERFINCKAMIAACEQALDKLSQGDQGVRLLRKPMVLNNPQKGNSKATPGEATPARSAPAAPEPSPPPPPANTADPGQSDEMEALPQLLDANLPGPEPEDARGRIVQKEKQRKDDELSGRVPLDLPMDTPPEDGEDAAPQQAARDKPKSLASDMDDPQVTALAPGVPADGTPTQNLALLPADDDDADTMAQAEAAGLVERTPAAGVDTDHPAGAGTEALRRMQTDKVKKSGGQEQSERKPASFIKEGRSKRPTKIAVMPMVILITSLVILVAVVLYRFVF